MSRFARGAVLSVTFALYIYINVQVAKQIIYVIKEAETK